MTEGITMKVLKYIGMGVLALLVVAVTTLAIAISYTEDCGPAPAIAGDVETMKASRFRCYGSPDVIELAQIEKPAPASNEVLIKIHAASVNPYDWHQTRGSPYLLRLGAGLGAPNDTSLGVDFAGTVEAVGSEVTRFEPGDEVFGGWAGAFAEYLVMPEDRALAPKPENVSFEEGASVAVAALSALQALRDQGQLQAGQKVLINGASGGVGTFAVQLAKIMGAEVHGVCSGRNVDMVRSIGADHVFNYKVEDYTESGEQYDLIVDNVGNHSPLKNREVLKPGGKLVLVGGKSGDWLIPFIGPLQAMIASIFVDEELGMMLARLRGDDLAVLAEYMAAGEVTPVIDRRFSLDEIADAIAYSETGRARGKIIINLE
jgi:NADPH:quinone reductase-like Zn-dependent oxidoreductase